MSYTLDFPIQYIPNPDRFATIGLGELYIGVVDGDPASEPADRIQVYIARQNDTDLPIAQPIELSAGGVPVYLGSPVTLKIDQEYSVAVLDKHGQQVFYSPKTGEIIAAIEEIYSNISIRLIYVNTILEASSLTGLVAGQQISVAEYNAGTGKGGGILVFVSGSAATDYGTIFPSATPGGYLTRQDKSQLTVHDFGAVGDGVVDDTLAVFRNCAYINDRGRGYLHFPPGVYLYTKLNKSILTPDGAWRSEIIASISEEFVFPLMNVNNVKVSAEGAVIYAKDNGIGTFPHGLLSHCVFAVFGSKSVVFENVNINGNRAGQAHTEGTDLGHNYGIGINDYCENIKVINSVIENMGSRRTGIDKRGDCVYINNGAIDVLISGNELRNPGRWGVALEDGRGGSNNIVVTKNQYYGNDRNSADPLTKDTLGFIDIESYRNHSGIRITHNDIYVAGSIAFTGYSTSVASCTIDDVVIDSNTWHMESITGSDARHDPITMSGAADGVNTFRKYSNVTISNNKLVLGSSGVANNNRVALFELSWFENVKLLNNNVNQNNTAGFNDAGMLFENAKLTGFLTYDKNEIKSNQFRRWIGWASGLSSVTFGASNVVIRFSENTVNGARSPYVVNSFNASDTGSVYLERNLYKNIFEAGVIAGPGSFFVSKNELPLASDAPSPVGAIKSNIALGDTVAAAFKIVSVGAAPDATTVVNVVWNSNDSSSSSGIVQFSAGKNDGTWTLGTVTTSMTNATAPSVAVVGADIVISGRKAAGGANAAPSLSGMIACANCQIISA